MFQVHPAISAGSSVPPEFLSDPEVFDALSSEEMEYDWRRCVLPLVQIEFRYPLERNALSRARVACPIEEMRRFQRIQRWARKHGGIAAALEKAPILLIVDAKGVQAIDGWHRTVLAKAAGMEDVPCYVGISTTTESQLRRLDGEPL